MNKKTSEFTGVILLLLGLRGAVGIFSLAVKFGSEIQFMNIIVTGSITALAMLICGIMLTACRSLKAACTVLGVSLAAKGVYCIIAACISIPQLKVIMNTPDSQLPGLNALSAALGILSVEIMFIEAALSIVGAAFGIVFMRKDKLFIPAVVFLILPIIFLFAADKGNGTLLWLLFLAAVIYTKQTAAAKKEKIKETKAQA